jgi:protein-ribulosamine 3-kinase
LIVIDFDRLADGIHRIDFDAGQRAFVKVRRGVPADFFAAEARGLALLAGAEALRVPRVLALSEHGIGVEDLGAGRATASNWEDAGRNLAAMHRQTCAHFGFASAGWCGDSAQDNTQDEDGFRFFVERRLLAQGQRAMSAGRLERRDMRALDAICGRLRELLPQRPAVLVHGDLWTGNLHGCANGELVLIDGAAAHYGWAEGDLAMLTLFGEPPALFFAAYEETAQIASDWRDRAPLLNLYHVLNHLNLFGNGYRAAVQAVLHRYA